MLKEWFVNFTIFISFMFIYNHLLMHYENRKISERKSKILKGVLGGILGFFLMFFGVQITNYTSLDLRYLVIIYVLNYFGSLAACIASFIIILFIIALNGFNYSTVINICGVIVITIFGLSIIRNKKKLKDNLLILNIQGLFLMTIIFRILEPSFKNYFLIIQYWIVILLIGALTYALKEYLIESRNAIQALKEEASKDYLTGLFNVRTFNKMYIKLVDEYKEKDKNISFIMLDIDYFKKVNDTYGHNAGDEILIQIGEILRECSEESYILSRMGGEEFSIILIDYDKNMCFNIAEKIRTTVENSKFNLPSGENLNITVSLGIASYPEEVKNIGQLITRADSALYKAKNSGRNKVCDNSLIDLKNNKIN